MSECEYGFYWIESLPTVTTFFLTFHPMQDDTTSRRHGVTGFDIEQEDVIEK